MGRKGEMSQQAFRERFQRMPWPEQLGNLASTLARISSRCSRPDYDPLVNDLLREAARFIEWSAPFVPPALRPDLAAMQREALAWRQCWPLDAARPLLALWARNRSDFLLRQAGLQPPPSSRPEPSWKGA